MLRAAVVLGLLCLAHGALVQKKGAGDLKMPNKVDSDEDVKQIFRFMVSHALELEKKLRASAPLALEALQKEDPEAEMEKVIEDMDKNYEYGMDVFGKVLHGLGLLSDGIFQNLEAFKRSEGGCAALSTLAANGDFSDEQKAAVAAAGALSADLHCMADDFAKAEGAPIDQYKTSEMTADDALNIVEAIARALVKSHEDGLKMYMGASTILEKLSPALKAKLDAALSTRSSREMQMTRLLRTLLAEINRRK